MLKFGLLEWLNPAIARKNLRAGGCRIGKNRVNNSSCTAPALAVISQPMKQHNTLRRSGLFIPCTMAAIALLVTACAETVNTRGQIILPTRLAQVHVGQTTRQDVIQLLGSPSAQGTMNDNRWYYITTSIGTTSLDPYDLKSRQVVIIDFDPKTDVVASLTEKSATDGKEVSPDEHTTPTHGQSMGIIDQLTGSLGGLMKK